MPLDPVFDVASAQANEAIKFIGEAGEVFGRSIAAGDVNGDGFLDVLVGAPFNNSAGTEAGAAYLILGQDLSGFVSAGGQPVIDVADAAFTVFRIDAANEKDSAGLLVAMGDVNGDGFADILVGSPRAEGVFDGGNIINAGAVDVIFGGAAALEILDQADGEDDGALNVAQLDGADGFRLEGHQTGDILGGLGRIDTEALDTGDINGDGFDDIIIGGSRYDSAGRNNNGGAFVLFGQGTAFDPLISTASFDGADGFRLLGEASFDQAGSTVTLADVNGDGLADAIVGARAANSLASYSGRAHVLFGKSGGFSANEDLADVGSFSGFKIEGPVNNAYAGMAIKAGDINGDGVPDLIVGMPGASIGGDDVGAIGVFFGGFGPNDAPTLAGLNGANGFRIDGFETAERIGEVIAVGDVNGDGVDDILTGSYTNDTGREFVIYGKPDDAAFPAVFNVSQLDGQNGFAIESENLVNNFGRNLLLADINGDGFDDLFIADDRDSANGINAGAVQIVFGEATGPLTLTGDNFANTLRGSAFSDVLAGRAGPDRITGGDGDDDLKGEDGGDDIFGEDGDDAIAGGADNDEIDGGRGDDVIHGGSGDDLITGGFGDDTAFGGSGDDSFNGILGRDVIDGGDGFDLLRNTFESAGVHIEAKLQNSRVAAFVDEGGGPTLEGLVKVTSIEQVIGGPGDDLFIGGDENVSFVGGAGRDVLFGGVGDDDIDGGDDDDELQGQIGDDSLLGGGGDDFLRGGAGDDEIEGGAGDDSGLGDSGADRFLGEDGDDLFFGGVGDDILAGGDGADRLRGDTQNDVLAGGDGDDSLVGGSGDDTLRGGDDRDTLLGENGADRLEGGAGIDLITGGAGVDRFVFSADFDLDKIFDFEDGVELLEFDGVVAVDDFDDLTVTAFNLGQDTKIAVTADPTNFIVLVGVQSSDIDANDFIITPLDIV